MDRTDTMCTNAELILGYVYGELPDADRLTFETHIAGCPVCATEVAGLRATRGHLASWAPPEPDFGLRIVRGTNTAAPPARRFAFARAWGLAAAAVLVLAAAAAIANVEVRYDSTGLTVRTGWVREAPAQSAAVTDAGVTDEWRAKISALQSRLDEFEAAASSRENDTATRAAFGPRMSDAEIIRRVREIVSQSETRQQREFALQLARVVGEVDRARKMDFLTVQQGIGRLRGQIPADVQQHLNYYLTRVSQEK